MEAIYIFLTSLVIITTCSARTYSSSSSSDGAFSTGAIVGIALGAVAFFTLLVVFIACMKMKQAKARRINAIPTAMQMAALAQEENRYKPPGSVQVPSYNQPPPYNQAQPSKMTPVS
ncbi:unnamed protein product [Adineta steineri]|uniref:Uncharacterized protein n=1 Tax=Adineta steineri TaxID=433720 RepID=A0A815C3D7_9BILA|nr:unnamed protein product [Adineta steineri]CAF1279933.1 unnamed protein product [Adineta steineri]CAF1317033.1 unnamed protein product [Adineta steineri]CAF1582826.1 unnamed protein product [Adineta steineri]